MSNLEVNSPCGHICKSKPLVVAVLGNRQSSPFLPTGIITSELQQKQGKIQVQVCSLEATRDSTAIGDSHTGLGSLERAPDLLEPGARVRQRPLSGLPETAHGQGLAQGRALLQGE